MTRGMRHRVRMCSFAGRPTVIMEGLTLSRDQCHSARFGDSPGRRIVDRCFGADRASNVSCTPLHHYFADPLLSIRKTYAPRRFADAGMHIRTHRSRRNPIDFRNVGSPTRIVQACSQRLQVRLVLYDLQIVTLQSCGGIIRYPPALLSRSR
jgi:hypothetical protein